VSRFRFVFRSLIATTVMCGAFAANSAPADVSALTPDSEHGEAASAGDAPVAPQERTAEQDDRAYLVATASPGDTMTRQGPELAIARLNPEFVARLADAIREARQSGLPSVGIFSAYRPPGFGIGGFGDKFKSLHAYGLAVDMSGIGDPGSGEAKLWHEVAARHGVICPYGYASRTEWNHCQAAPLEKVRPEDPLRKTITAEGPVGLAEMFAAGKAIIADLPAAISAALTANTQKGSIFREASAGRAEEADARPAHRGRSRLGERVARAGRGVKTIVVAKNEERAIERSHAKRIDEAKARGSRKAAAPAESRRDPPRRRSHVA